MKISKLNNKLDSLMEEYIKTKEYVDTGSLLKSIKFKCKFNENTYEFDVEFIANDYIKYLDDGNFIQDFLAEERTEKVIADFIASQITL